MSSPVMRPNGILVDLQQFAPGAPADDASPVVLRQCIPQEPANTRSTEIAQSTEQSGTRL
jgi:hypothetical protein